jgi:hypothetical protein
MSRSVTPNGEQLGLDWGEFDTLTQKTVGIVYTTVQQSLEYAIVRLNHMLNINEQDLFTR